MEDGLSMVSGRGHEGIDADGQAGRGEEAARRDECVQGGVGKAVEIGIDAQPGRKRGVRNGPGQGSAKGPDDMGRGIDSRAEMVEKDGILGAFDHEKMGHMPTVDDGKGIRCGRGGIAEGRCGIHVAGEVFPIE